MIYDIGASVQEMNLRIMSLLFSNARRPDCMSDESATEAVSRYEI